MTPKTCDKCDTIFSTNFCPNCGRKYEDIVVSVPVQITTYVHGSKEDGLSICKKYSIDPESELGHTLMYLNYEVKLVYEIVGNDIFLKQVDSGDGRSLRDVI